MRKVCHVDDYGAKGDGESYDDEAIQAAIDRAVAINRPVELDARTYLLQQPLRIPSFLHLRGSYRGGEEPHVGAGDGRTILRAAGPMRAVLELSGNRVVRLSDIVLDANWQAEHALYLAGSSLGTFERITCGGALRDGVHLAKAMDDQTPTINDGNEFMQVDVSGNGRFFRTPGIGTEHLLAQQIVTLEDASAETVAGSFEIEFTGVDLTMLGLRPGDPIRVAHGGAAREYTVIAGVLSSTVLKVATAPDVTGDGFDFAIGSGDGYHEVDGHGDNNGSIFFGGLFRFNAGFSIALGGGYGCSVYSTQFDYGRFWSVRLGCYNTDPLIGTTTSISPAFVRPYFEAFEAAPIYVCSCLGAGVYNPVASEALCELPYPGSARGVIIDDYGVRPIGFLRNKLASTHGLDMLLEGHTRRGGVVIQGANPSATHDYGATHWVVREAEDVTWTGTPTLAQHDSKEIFLTNDGPGNLTLRDESQLAGSGLRLGGADVTIVPGSTLHLICCGAYWSRIS